MSIATVCFFALGTMRVNSGSPSGTERKAPRRKSLQAARTILEGKAKFELLIDQINSSNLAEQSK